MRLTKEQWTGFFAGPFWSEISEWLDSQLDQCHTDFERVDPEQKVQVARIQGEVKFIKKMTAPDFKEKLFDNGRKRDDRSSSGN